MLLLECLSRSTKRSASISRRSDETPKSDLNTGVIAVKVLQISDSSINRFAPHSVNGYDFITSTISLSKILIGYCRLSLRESAPGKRTFAERKARMLIIDSSLSFQLFGRFFLFGFCLDLEYRCQFVDEVLSVAEAPVDACEPDKRNLIHLP